MITPLRFLLSLSLGLNLVAGATLVHRHLAGSPPDAMPGRSAVAGPASSTPGAASAKAPVPAIAPRAPTAPPATPTPSLDELRQLKADLLAEGYPPQVVSSILAVAVDQKYGVYELEKKLRGNSDPALRQQLKDRLKLGEADIRALTDTHTILDASRDRIYAARYGDLSLEKIEAIRKLENDNASRELSDRKFAAALQPLLSAAQIDAYMRYNSIAAKQIQLTLSSIDVEEDVYRRLLEAAIARDGSPMPDLPASEIAQRNRQPATVETYRQALGDERFLRIVARFDSTIATADAVYQVAGLSPQLRAELFLDAYRAMDQHRLSPDRAARQAAALATHRALVEKARLTPEQVEGFDRMLGLALKRGDFGGSGGLQAGRSW